MKITPITLAIIALIATACTGTLEAVSVSQDGGVMASPWNGSGAAGTMTPSDFSNTPQGTANYYPGDTCSNCGNEQGYAMITPRQVSVTYKITAPAMDLIGRSVRGTCSEGGEQASATVTSGFRDAVITHEQGHAGILSALVNKVFGDYETHVSSLQTGYYCDDTASATGQIQSMEQAWWNSAVNKYNSLYSTYQSKENGVSNYSLRESARGDGSHFWFVSNPNWADQWITEINGLTLDWSDVTGLDIGGRLCE